MSFYQNLLEKISVLEHRVEEKKIRDSQYPWYLGAAKEGKRFLPWFVYAEELPDRLKLRFLKLALYLTRIWMIASGAPSSNFNIFTQAGKEGVYICNYNYCYYKGFHKKTKWKFISMVTAATIIVSLIVALIFPGEPRAKAAMVTWAQADWRGGADTAATGYAAHTTDQSGWTKYYSKSTSVAIDAGTGVVTESQVVNQSYNLVTTDDSSTDTPSGFTTTSGFNKTGNAKSSNVLVSGTGASADLMVCDYNHGGASWTPTNGDTYDLDATAGIEIAGVHCNINVFTVAAGTTSVKAYDGTNYGRLAVYATSATITGTLSATGKGYAGGAGPGTGMTCSGCNGGGTPSSNGGGGGGGYGGNGSVPNGTGGVGGQSYGSITTPNDLGSGGGSSWIVNGDGGAGGGFIKLNLTSALTNNGSIKSDGNTGTVNGGNTGGGGSGGTIYLNAGSLAGSGSITANGANSLGNSGAGGGGRIAIYSTNFFSGSKTAYSGTGAKVGGAGTIYEKDTDDAVNIYGNLIVNNNAVSGAVTTIVDAANTFDNLTISGAANLSIPSGKTVTTATDGTFILDTAGTFTTVDTALTVNGTLDLKSGTLSVNSSTKKLTFGSAGNLIIRSGAVLTHDVNSTTALGQVNYIDWALASVDIKDGGSINVNEKGYDGGPLISNDGEGPGKGSLRPSTTVSGAGYGGTGGSTSTGAGGSVYDGNTCAVGGTTYTTAKCLGSGGAGVGGVAPKGGKGGGLIRLNLSASINLNSTGSISSNGGNGAASGGGAGAGGSGGSVYINTLAISGSGTVSANGGNSTANDSYRGGGAGGRIVIYYTSGSILSTVSKVGGTGGDTQPGAGTYYYKAVGGYSANRNETGGTLSYGFESNQNKFASIENESGVMNVLSLRGAQQGDTAISNSSSILKTQNTDCFALNTGLAMTGKEDCAYARDSSPALRMTENIKSFISEIFSQAKNVFDFAFGVPTASAAVSETFTSAAFDTTFGSVVYGNISWTASIPAGATLKFQIAANTDNATWTFKGPDGNTNSYYTTSSGQAIYSGFLDQRYFKFKAFIDSAAAQLNDVVIISDVTIAYSATGYPTDNQELWSSPYRAYDSAKGGNINVLSKIEWTETLPTINENVQFQIRTAPNVPGTPDSPGVWTAWCGRDDGTAGSCNSTMPYAFTDPAGNEQIDDIQRDGHNDEWIQYRVYLTSGGVYPATLSVVNFKYILNTAPQVTVTSAVQGSDGAVAVDYKLSDVEETNVNVSLFADIGVNLNETLGYSSDPGAGAITVSDASFFPNPAAVPAPSCGSICTIQIENEQITYTGKSGNDLTGAVRAANNTKYAAHASGVDVWIKATTVSGNVGALSGIPSSPPASANESASWTIAADLPGVYSTTAKIRVSANDYNAANPIQVGNPVGTGDLADVTLDNVVPTSVSFKINPNAAGDTLTNITATEPSTPLSVRFINSSSSDGSTCSADIAGATYQALAGSSAALSLVPIGQINVVCLQVKDARGNQSAAAYAITPTIPVNMNIADLSAVPVSKSKTLAWWSVVSNADKYNVWRCVQTATEITSDPNKCENAANYGGAPYVVITTSNGATNYCYDEGDGNCTESSTGALVSTSKYWYKVTSENSGGNSSYSAKVSAIPDGSTGGEVTIDTTPPSFTVSPSAGGTTQTSTSITWTTDEDSYSLVKYGTDQNNLNLIAGNATESVKPHSVNLSGLSGGTLYYYQILSADAAGNLLKSPATPPAGLYTFTTLSDSAAPSIVGTPSVIAGQTSATISWTTSEASTSRVKYIEALDNTTDPATGTATALQSELVTNHIVIITGLTADTIYNYQVISADGSSNAMTYQSSAPFNQFNTATTADITAPTLDVAPTDTGTTQIATTIGWTTNENSYSVVKYGTATNNLNLTAGSVIDSATVHSVAISNLSPGTLYYYQIFSADSSGNLLKSPVTPPAGLYTFTTVADSTPPVLVGTPAVVPGRDSATISWVTDEASSTRLKYVAAIDNTTVPATFTALQPELVTNHFVIIPSGLVSSTTYNYQIISADSSSNTLTSPSAAPYLQFDTDFDKADPTAPTISFTEATQGPSVANSSLNDTTASATFSANENAFFSIVYEASATAPASYSKENGYPSLITANMDYAVTIEGLVSNTKYYYKLRARDLYGNMAELGPYNFTTTRDDIAPNITFNSATGVSLSATSAIIAWTTNEASTSRVDYGTTLSYELSPVSSAALDINHNVTLTGLSPSTEYFFKITSADSAANSTTNDNSASGFTFTTLPEPPTISAVNCNSAAVTGAGACNPNPSSTSVIISWTTNQKSSSLVDFGTALSYGITQGDITASNTSHFVTLSGLAPNTIYKYRVKSVNSSGDTAASDNSGQGYAFTTGTNNSLAVSVNLSVSSVSVVPSSVTANSAVISWTASDNSDGIIAYSADNGAAIPSYSFEAGDLSATTSHKVTLVGLAPSTKYYFKVKARSRNQSATVPSSGNEAAQKETYSFTTLSGSDRIPPDISNIQVTSVTSNQATITWDTNENSTSYVEFGTAIGVYSSVQGNPSDSTNSHSVTLISLTPETPYYFQVRSSDAAGNKAVMAGAGFTTTAGAAVNCPDPIPCRSCPAQEACPAVDTASPVISDIKISAVAFNTATITWTTNEASNSMIGYDVYSYDIKGKYAYSSGNSKESVLNHSVTLNNLDSASIYYFRVLSTDVRGNTAESKDQTFKTPAISESKDKGAATADTLKKEFESIAKTLVKDNLATEENIKDILSRITNPPVIGSEGPIIKDIKSYGATIVWQTDRKANSVVKFTAEKNGNSLSKQTGWEERGKLNEFDTKHEVSLLGLAPSTSYFFQAQSQDILGNTSSSEIKSFTTSSASSIFNVLVTDLNLTSAKITWETANISTSSIEYGYTSSYGNYLDNKDEKVKNHAISLANLAPNSTFHFRVRSTEELGAILVSDDYTFSTPALPEITKYTLGEIKDNSIALSWTSNIPIDSNIRYTDKDANDVKNIGKEEKSLDHSIVIANLDAGKVYKIEIQGRDDANNMASIPAFEVQTGMDAVSPEISQVRSQSAVLSTADDKVQSIISWRTNELASTKILWDLGGTKGDNLANETALDANLTTNHIVVLTQFKPGTVYRFRVVSADKFGNVSTSADYTVLAPVKRQSIIQMIINQFENIFGWTKGIGR